MTATCRRSWMLGARTLALLGWGVAALGLVAPAADAHGTRFFPPQRPPPTSPRLPSLPPIPVLPPPTGVPPPPTTPTAPRAPLTGPTAPPTLPSGPRTLASRRTRLGAYRSLGTNTWTLWWALHRTALLPDRLEGLRRRTMTPRDGDRPLEASWGEARADVARRTVLPFLLRLLDPKARTRDDVRASALLALGRCGDAGVSVPVLSSWLHDARAADIVRESAVLAVGLLRRTSPAQRCSPLALDRLRDDLLDVFDDSKAPTRVRAFAALSLGLLADQDYATGWTKDGRLVSRALWLRLEGSKLSEELTTAVLTAVGMQPPDGLSEEQRAGLQGIAMGKRLMGRAWSNAERSHALTAALRIGGPRAAPFLVRMLEQRRAPQAVRRSVFIALGEHVPRMAAEDRYRVGQALAKAIKSARDPLTHGLAQIAAGFLLEADLAAGRTRVLDDRDLARLLVVEAQRGQPDTRGFSALALALAVRGARAGGVPGTASAFVPEASGVLREGLSARRSDVLVRGAFAVAVGVAGMRDEVDTMCGLVDDTHAPAALRGYAAVALGHLGVSAPGVVRSLRLALVEKHEEGLRRDAALALAMLGGRSVTTTLLKELERGGTEQLFGEVVVALGVLGDLGAVDSLIVHANDRGRSELSQALAVVALGRLVDPEPRPSLTQLTRHANYPARTASLEAAYSIL